MLSIIELIKFEFLLSLRSSEAFFREMMKKEDIFTKYWNALKNSTNMKRISV